jgi:hypothetical protein
MHESHFFFDAGAVLVAASVLLAIAAVAQTVWLHARPAGATKPGARHSSVYSSWADSLLLVAVASSWYNVGAGWVVHLVCYPIYPDMSEYGSQAFHAYSHGYLSRFPAAIWPVGLCVSLGQRSCGCRCAMYRGDLYGSLSVFALRLWQSRLLLRSPKATCCTRVSLRTSTPDSCCGAAFGRRFSHSSEY